LLGLPPQVREKFYAQLSVLLADRLHPSLRTKKVQGQRGVFEARIDRSYRFTFHYEGDTVVLRGAGSHDQAFRNP
jgi:hypothetical protein